MRLTAFFAYNCFSASPAPEHRWAMLGEFHRASRDTLIVAVRIDAHFKRRRAGAGTPVRQIVSKVEVETEFKQAGFRLLSHQDFLPGCVRMRVYVLRKTR